MNRVPLVAALVLLSISGLGCRHAQPVGPAPEFSDPVASRALEKVSDDFWDAAMKRNPVWATYLGDRRFDDQLPDITPQGIHQALESARFLSDSAKAIDPNALNEQDRLTRAMLMALVDGELATEVCHSELWDVNALDGIQTQLGELPELHGISNKKQADALVARYRKSGDYLDQHLSNLRTGMKDGYTASKIAVGRVIDQLDAMVKDAPESSPFVTSVKLPDDFSDKDRAAVTKALVAAVDESLFPGLRRYRDFLRNEYLPSAREEISVEKNKDGKACYRARILEQTHSELSPEQIHRIGMELAEKNVAEMKAIAKKLTGTEDLGALEAYLAKDPSQHVQTRAELVAYAQKLIDRAQAKLPELFGVLPRQQVKVKPIEEFRETSSPMGYYYSGSESENRPGYFYINTHAPEQQPLYLFESLTFHEAVPGHHLQGAIAQEVQGMPRFRREMGDSAYTEGWAHYAELLADENGMYSGDAGRFGMLSDQSLRAVRLVVDTGMHDLGWSRQQALDYMLSHTAEPRDDAEREIDRYIVWPGQALCYKLGQLEILKLRAEAKEKLGARFDIRRFHDAILGNGALPLPVLHDAMEDWMKREAAAK